MGIAISDFWRLLDESRLLAAEDVQRLKSEFGQLKGAGTQSSAKTLTAWLIDRNAITPYQAMVLSAGRSGPFYYGDYCVYDRVADGRLAGRFRAIHRPTQFPVLLEFLAGDEFRTPAVWSAASEFTIRQAALVDDHVHRLFEPVDVTQFKFVAEEDLYGQSLEERLAAGPLAPPEAAHIFRQVALGLAAFHESVGPHGDIRPANIWLSEDGAVKLLRDPVRPIGAIDFARPECETALRTRGDWLAPELSFPDRPPTRQSDLYSLGCSIYQSLAGRAPFAGGDPLDKPRRHVNEPAQPLESFGAPSGLAQLVMYMMAKNPGVRYQQASVVAEHLTAFADSASRSPAPSAVSHAQQNYERWIKQKQASLASEAKRHREKHGVAAPQIQAGGGDTRGGAKTASASSSAAPIIAGDSAGKKGASPLGDASPSAARAGRRKEMTPKKLATILGAIAVGLVAMILLVNMFGGGDETAENANGQGNGAVLPHDNSGAVHNTASSGTGGASGKGPTSGDTVSENVGTTSNAGSGGPSTSSTGNTSSGTTGDDSGSSGGATGTTGGNDAAQPPALVQEIIDSDTEPWASPTSGPPLDFRYVPRGGQMFLSVRPAELMADPEGERVIRALGPKFEQARADWEKAAGIRLNQVEQLIVAFYENEGQWPRTASVVRMNESVPRESLVANWGNPSPAKVGSFDYFAGSTLAYWIPPDGGDRIFVMGDAKDIEATASIGGAAPSLRREIERLQESVGSDRHFTLLFAPNFLNVGGAKMFEGDLAKVREPIDWFLGDGLTGGLVSAHFGEQASYFEVRLAATADRDRLALANEFRDRLAKVPDNVFNYLVALNAPEYWRAVAFKYPEMVRVLHRQSRVAGYDEQAIINAVVPGPAAHNLVFGGEMLIESSPGQVVASTGNTAAPSKKVPQSIDEVLQTKTSLSFSATQLEFSVRDLAADLNDELVGMPFEFKIIIVGKDLETDGITRNQQVRDFDQRDKTVAEILTAIVFKANPVPNLPNTMHPDQKLIWVVAANPSNPDEQVVLLTTRAAAARQKYTLPKEFILPEAPK